MTPAEKEQKMRQALDALSSKDLDTLSDIFAEDLIWIEPPGTSLGGEHHGRDEVFKHVFDRFWQDWEEFSYDIHEVLSKGHHTVGVARWRGQSKHTGKTYEDYTMLETHLEDDGKIHKARVYRRDPGQLKEALGE